MKCAYCGNYFKYVKFTESKLKFINMHLCNKCFRNILKHVFRYTDRYMYLQLKKEFCKLYKEIFKLFKIRKDK